MHVAMNDNAIKRLKTKRLLRYGTAEPQELYQAIEELKDEMLFEPLTAEKFTGWFESLRSKLNNAVALHIIKDFRIEWDKRIDSDIIELRVNVQEHATTEIRQVNVTFQF